MCYDNGEEQTRIKCTKKHNNRARTTMETTQDIWGIYGYLPFKTSFLSLIYQHTSMTQVIQALRTLTQSKDWIFNVNLTQTCKYKMKNSYGWNPNCLTCVCLSQYPNDALRPSFIGPLQTENKTETRIFGVLWPARPGRARVQSLLFFEWAAAVMVRCFPYVFSCSMHIQEPSSSTPLPPLMHTKSGTLITSSSDPNFNPPYSIALTSSLLSVQDNAWAMRCSKSSLVAWDLGLGTTVFKHYFIIMSFKLKKKKKKKYFITNKK